MTAGHTLYYPIAEIDKREFKHLKNGRPVLVLECGEPITAEFVLGRWWAVLFDNLEIDPTHFSTHDPRPIGECVEKQCWAIEMNKGFDPHDHYFRDDCYVGTTIVREPLNIEVTSD